MKLRQLSNHELSLLATHTIHSISSYYGIFSVETFSKAILRTVKKHPFLNSRILFSDKTFYLDEIDGFEPRITLIEETGTKEAHHAKFLEISKTSCDVNKELCFFSIICNYSEENRQYFSIIASISHTIADARSIIDFHHQIIQEYHDLIKGIELKPSKLSPKDPVATIVKRLYPDCKPSPFISDELLTNKLVLCPIQPDKINSTENTVEYFFHEFSKEQTQKILTSCRKNNVSITSAIASAQINAFKSITDINIYKFVIHHILVDLRPMIGNELSNNDMVMAIYPEVSAYDFTSDDFWKTALEVQSNIHRAVNSDIVLSKTLMDHMNPFLFATPSLLKKNSSPKGNITFTSYTSNCGIVKLEYEFNELLELKNFEVLLSKVAESAGGMTVYTVNDCLCLNMSYTYPKYSKEKMNKYFENFLTLVSENCLI